MCLPTEQLRPLIRQVLAPDGQTQELRLGAILVMEPEEAAV